MSAAEYDVATPPAAGKNNSKFTTQIDQLEGKQGFSNWKKNPNTFQNVFEEGVPT